MLRWLDEEALHATHQMLLVDGRQVEIITAEFTREAVTYRVEVQRDIEKNLMIRSTYENLQDARKSLAMACDYPGEGPQSIYDLGAAAETKVISLFLPPEISELIRKLDTLRKTHLTRYVAVSVPTGTITLPTSFTGRYPARYFTAKDDLISAIWRDGEDRHHVHGYLPAESQGATTTEQAAQDPRQIAASLIPAAATVYQGRKRHFYYYQILDGARVRHDESERKRGPIEVMGREIYPEQIGWPQINLAQWAHPQWRMESVSGPKSENLILIERRTEGGNGTVERWFLNPAKDFFCQKHEIARSSDGSVFLSMEILEYAQTPTGQWYPHRLQKMEESPRTNGRGALETCSRDLFLQEEPEFPPKLFDPASLPSASE